MSDDQLADYAVGSPARLALNVLAHKWTLLIVLALKRGPLRFTRLRSQVPGVTSQVLRDSLRELERDGIVVRQEFVATPPHVEYSLTELGATLCEPARAIRAWAEKNGPAVLAARQSYDGGAGGALPRGCRVPPPPRRARVHCPTSMSLQVTRRRSARKCSRDPSRGVLRSGQHEHLERFTAARRAFAGGQRLRQLGVGVASTDR